MKKSKEKIDTQASQEGLHNPFSSFQLDNIPLLHPPLKTLPPELPVKTAKRGRVVLRRETAHRGGKTVIVIGDFPSHIPEREFEALARGLKKHCSCGGAVKNREIEIQGDQPAAIRAFLTQAGFHVAGITS